MTVQGVGLGFRRNLSREMLVDRSFQPAFIELAPENWIDVGGQWGRVLRSAVEKYPLLCHGLSLSLGSPDPLEWDFLRDLKRFFKAFPVQIYSEHLSYSKCDNAHLYDLLPIPFRWDAVRHVAQRIREVQDFLERRIAIENVSYYMPVAPEMDEATFLRAVLEEADCDLLLDVNNVYVNSFNHKYDAKDFIQSLPLERVSYIHMAGHEQESEDLIIDTHGQAVADEVYKLFAWTLPQLKPVPVLLERDFNFPSYDDLLGEVRSLQVIVDQAWSPAHVANS